MLQPIKAKLRRNLMRFRKEEDGSIVVLTLFLIIAMIWTTGIAVDMMRFETYRARLQSTVDRAVLAAADLDVCLDMATDPADIVREYLRTNGFENQVRNINVVRDGSSCEVTAEARIDINTIFMGLIGFGEIQSGHQTLGTTAASGATESIDNVEVSLVLDVSGSMRGNKIVQLRDAASDFVTTVHDSVEEERLHFSVIPYATSVNIGADLYAQYRTRYRHDNSYCLDLPASTYSTTQIPYNVRYDQSAHFDADGGASYSSIRRAGYNGNRRDPSYWACNPEPTRWILPFSNEVDRLTDHINALEAGGWTSIDHAANWGVALLDPDTRPIAAGLASDGAIDSIYADRPADYNVAETLKVLVLMTDGENTRDYVMATNRRHQWADVWFSWNMEYDDDGDFEGDDFDYEIDPTELRVNVDLRGVNVEYDDRDPSMQFFVRDREPNDFDGDGRSQEWHYWVEGVFVDHDGRDWTPLRRDDSPPVWTNQRYGARQQWNDIWARFTVRAHAWNFRGDQIDDFGQYNDWYNNLVTVTYGAEKDQRLASICTAAKDEGIVIFTIGFEVSNRAAQIMSDCATSPNHFYRVDGLEIADAFASIANQISALRLFQ